MLLVATTECDQAAQFADNEVACKYVFSEDLSSLPICV